MRATGTQYGAGCENAYSWLSSYTMHFLIIRCCIFVVRRKEEKKKAKNSKTARVRSYPLVVRFHSGGATDLGAADSMRRRAEFLLTG